MRSCFSILLYFTGLFLVAQVPIYEEVQSGPFRVGYSDTILFNANLAYNEYGYTGPAPLFVQIWHPSESGSKTSFLTYGDFRKRNVPSELTAVYAELSAQMDASFIVYNVREDFPSYDPIHYGNHMHDDVLAAIKTFPTSSSYARINPASAYPVIIYHHGSQGLPDENYMMAEYFASRGFVFISANHHLPYSNSVYGLTEGLKNDLTGIRTVNEFARTLSHDLPVFFIGHSWGAQVGWCYLHEEGWVDAFVSMETTIEFKTDPLEIEDKWPFVHDVIMNQEKVFPVPVLMFANTREDKPFGFFENLSAEEMIHASSKQEFGHESYTSAYFLRYFFRDRFPQPDTVSIQQQIDLYTEHLELTEAFLQSVVQQVPFDKQRFRNRFFIN